MIKSRALEFLKLELKKAFPNVEYWLMKKALNFCTVYFNVTQYDEDEEKETLTGSLFFVRNDYDECSLDVGSLKATLNYFLREGIIKNFSITSKESEFSQENFIGRKLEYEFYFLKKENEFPFKEKIKKIKTNKNEIIAEG